jgi:hypothetical protein
MKITDIIPDFSTMSDTDLENVIRQTRRSRTTKKEISLKARPTKDATKNKDSVTAAIEKMSPEQLELLKKLFSS